MITITVSGSNYSHDATPAQVAGLGAARARVMSQLPPGEGQTADTPLAERPGYIADDAAYLQSVVAPHCERTGENPQEVMVRCLTSWANEPPPPPEEPETEPLSPEAAKAKLVAYALDKRWRVETGGLTLGGVRVQTDDRAKLLLLGAAQSMADGSSAPLMIGGVNYGSKTKVEFQAINAAVVAHVQATFPRLAAIESGEITTTAQIEERF